MKPVTLALLLGSVLWGQNPAGGPVLSLSANGETVKDLPRGWSLIIRAKIYHSLRNAGGNVAPVAIAPAGLSWADAVQIGVATPDGTQVALPFRLIGSPESAALSIAQKGYAELAWQVGPDDTAILALGSYRLHAALAVSGSPGWNGTVSSAEIVLRLVDEPSVLDEVQFTEKLLLLARFEKNRLNTAGAEAALADLLKAYPDSVEGNATLAAWREAEGKYTEAYQAIVKATDAYASREQKAAEPPFSLLELRRRLVQRLMNTQ